MGAYLRRAAALVIALGVVLGLTLSARADSFDDALARFAADNYIDTAAAVGAVASSGNAMAYKVIEALQDGRLYFNAETRKVYIKEKSGRYLDAATGQPVAGEPADLKPVRVNNRVRGAIEAALGALTLLSPDPAKRLEAAHRRGCS